MIASAPHPRLLRRNTNGVGELAQRLLGSPDIFNETADGRGGVNFVTAHAGHAGDLVTYNVKHNRPNGESNREDPTTIAPGTVASRARPTMKH